MTAICFSRGAAEKVAAIVRRGVPPPETRASNLRSFAVSLLVVVIVSIFLVGVQAVYDGDYLKSIICFTLGTLIIGIRLLRGVLQPQSAAKMPPVSFVPRPRPEIVPPPPGFWERKRDDLILILITTVLTAVLSVLGTLLILHLTKSG